MRWFFGSFEYLLVGDLESKIFLVWVDYFARYWRICITKRNWRRRLASLGANGEGA